MQDYDRGCGGKKVVMICCDMEISIARGIEEMEDVHYIREQLIILYIESCLIKRAEI